MTHAEGMPKATGNGLGLTPSRLLLALFFTFAGLMHFVRPGLYIAIVPSWLPNARLLVLVSGICEIMGGVGVLLPATRRIAAWGLIALLIAVFPANVHMLRLAYANHASSLWLAALWLRLPLQIPLLWWTWRAAARPRP
jgi:uncharacterized membrane protein